MAINSRTDPRRLDINDCISIWLWWFGLFELAKLAVKDATLQEAEGGRGGDEADVLLLLLFSPWKVGDDEEE